MKPSWTYSLANGARGLAYAREKGWLLVWDEKHWLYLLNQRGELQAQRQMPGALAKACAADDGTAYAAVGSQGEVCWLAPDLMPRWEKTVPQGAVSAALDPFGQYLAVADARGQLHVFDRNGRSVCRAENPRPLHHLVFVPAAPFLFGASDYGLVGCFDLAGQCVWRDGLVAHVGSLTVSGTGARAALACYTDGLHQYSLQGEKLGRQSFSQACRYASLSFDGRLILVAWLSRQLSLIDSSGQEISAHSLDKSVVDLALGALADNAFVALADGTILGLEVA